EVFIGEISTGAGNDLERATDIIKSMVMIYGMSDVAGLMVLEKQRNTFLGGGFGQAREFSEEMAQKVDMYIKDLLNERYNAVKERLRLYAPAVEKMVAELFDVEVIDGERVRSIISSFEQERGLPSLLQDEGDDFHPSKHGDHS
ncbi:MAG: cell division protein FtsH, partial [Campylobacterales bacterium]